MYASVNFKQLKQPIRLLHRVPRVAELIFVNHNYDLKAIMLVEIMHYPNQLHLYCHFFKTPHPLEDHAEKAVHTVCCRPGHVSCSITLPKRAYVSGENLRTEVVVHNMSIRKSGAVSLQLKQVIIKSMFRNKV